MGLVAVLLTASLTAALSRPRFVPLFRDLQVQDAAAITQKLAEAKIPYRLADNGNTVLVPQDRVYQTRLDLAGEGLPRQGVVGYEILDKPPLGATESDRRIAYLRALQGELARTVSGVEGVEEARVHIVIPEPQLFASQTKPVTAAVWVRLRPGAALGAEQVQGIVHLVTHSVEGLQPQDVTVVDQQGKVLSTATETAEATPLGAAGRLLDIQRQFQNDLERRLQGLLEQVLGPGNVVTRVNAELNFDSRTIERQTFEPGPGDGVVRSVQEMQETFQGAAGSAPPTGSDIPGYQAGGSGGPTSYQRTETTRNLEVGQVKEQTVISPGSVRRLSVAVVVNGQLSAAQQDAVSRVVAAAIGSDPQRQDQITVTGIPFQTKLVDLGQTPPPAPVTALPFDWRLAAAAGGAAVILALAVVFWRRRRRARIRPLVFPQPAEVVAAEPEPAPAVTAVGTPAEAAAAVEDAQVRTEIEKLARKSPETVAQLIRAWMAEE